MATAKKLPSGSYRIRVFDHFDTDADGNKKAIYQSFTASTKREAERAAAIWAANKTQQRPENITVKGALDKYIAAKEPVLSPSTIDGYRKMQRNDYSDIESYNLRQLDSTIVQTWISDLAARKSPKSVRNIYALLTASLDMFAPDLRLKVSLPAPIKPDLYCPDDADVKKLLKHIEGKELEIAVLLAAFGPMRRGEICALESSDIKGNIVTVCKDMVQGPDRKWVIKQPKTYSSYRQIEYPDFVIDKIKGIDGRIVKATPSQISDRFARAIRFSGSVHFRFHDLRHYSASIMHAMRVPDQYIMARGGWRTDAVLKSVYRNAISSEQKKQDATINTHFKNMYDTKYDT